VALEIIERLIASAPSLPPGGVITFLWKLKGETLAAMGRVDEAASLLNAAEENARALEERFLLWRIHASLRRLYVAMNDQEAARKEYSAGRELIGELAATLSDEALKESFLQGAYSMLEAR
jgi:tetratricopeptide (TPR) repeat protein